MTGEANPKPEICSNCFHYYISKDNVKQGECRRYPPDSFPIPIARAGNQAQFMTMMVMRQVPHDYNCGEYEPREPAEA